MNDLRFNRNLVILNGAVPLAVLAWDAWNGRLGSNAVNQAIHITGVVSLVFLALSLLVTPLRNLTGWNTLVAYRRALGLYAFVYAATHFTIYVLYDRAGDPRSTIEELSSRVYLQVGFVALLLMVPLAVTSTNGMISRLTPKRWKLLHRLAYAVAILGVLHFYLLVKSDVRLPLAFASVYGGLLGFRAVSAVGAKQDSKAKANTIAIKPTAKPQAFRGKMRVAAIFQETPSVKTFRFVPLSGGPRPFDFKAGQFLTIALPIDGKTHRRSYTIASAPTRVGSAEISVRRDPMGTVSRQLHDFIKVGDILDIAGPAGRFFIDTPPSGSVVLVAGGVGITPVMSMLRWLTDIAWDGPIYFVQAARNVEDLIFDEELRYLADRHPSLQRIIVLSDAPTSPLAHHHGRLTTEILATIPTIASLPVYLCGPQAMMDATGALLREMGAPAANLYTEAFAGPRPAAPTATEAAAEASDEALMPYALTFTKRGVTVEVDRSVTVLEAAEEAGVELSYECRSGICGQCKVRCLEGGVEMRVTAALTARDREAGYILACQATASGDAIAIDA